MSLNIPNHYTQQFSTNLQMLLQQKDTRLRSLVMSGQHVGEQASPVDQVAAIEMQDAPARFSPMGRIDAAVDRRWVFPNFYDLPQLLDSNDETKVLIDPKSKYTENAIAAAKRRMDREIISAFFADAKTGKNGSTTTSFPSSQQIAVNFGASGNVGLSVAKLREAKKKLRAAEVPDEDPLYCGLTAEQEDDLLAEAQIISLDYNDRPVLVDGVLKSFLGINFIRTELFAVDGSGYRRNPVWAKSGMYLGVWKDMKVSIDKRTDVTSLPWQAYIQLGLGATRLEEKKVIEIKCSEV